MKVYISGKITGLPLDEARAIFHEAHMALIEQGHQSVNPMNVLPYHPDFTWKDYMIADIAALMNCEAILMLHNWTDSKGAKIEHAIA